MPIQLPFEVIAHILSFLVSPLLKSPCCLVDLEGPGHALLSSPDGDAASCWYGKLEQEQRQAWRDLATAARLCRGMLPVVRRLMYSRITLASPRAARLLAQRLRVEREENLMQPRPMGLAFSSRQHKMSALCCSPTNKREEGALASGEALVEDISGFGRQRSTCHALAGSGVQQVGRCSLPMLPSTGPPPPNQFDQHISPLLQNTHFDGRSISSKCAGMQHGGPCRSTPSWEPLRVSELVQDLRFPHANGFPGTMDGDEDIGQWRCSLRTIFDFCPNLDSVALIIQAEGGDVLEELMGITTQARLKRLSILCTRWVALSHRQERNDAHAIVGLLMYILPTNPFLFCCEPRPASTCAYLFYLRRTTGHPSFLRVWTKRLAMYSPH